MRYFSPKTLIPRRISVYPSIAGILWWACIVTSACKCKDTNTNHSNTNETHLRHRGHYLLRRFHTVIMFASIFNSNGKSSSLSHIKREEREVVTIRFISLVFALATSIPIIVGLSSAWPTYVIIFNLFLIIVGSGAIEWCLFS